MFNNYREIIDSFKDCIEACESCTLFCLEEDNVNKMRNCIQLNLDCSNICGLGVALLSRQSDFARSAISLCADICAACAEECEKHDHNYCRKCAEACRKCEEACKVYLDTIRQAAVNS